METRAVRFISLFNKIEKEFASRLPDSKRSTFYDLIYLLQDKDLVIRNYSSKLKKYADLRNVIVHDTIDGKIVADPNEDAIIELELIYNQIASPSKVYPLINNKPPICLKPDDTLSTALKLSEEKKFSQIPIYNEQGYFGMFRSISIAHWLYNSIQDDIVSIKDTKVRDIIGLDDNERTVVFRSKNLNLFELWEIFQKSAKQDKKVDVVIITNKGLTTELPLTIFTEWDLPQIAREIKA